MPGPRSGFSAFRPERLPFRPDRSTIRRDRATRLFPFLLACLLAAVPPARAQEEFGRNKVQYGDKAWYVVSTRHFDIHFTEDGGAIGEFAAMRMESMYDSVSRIMGFPLKNRVPVILYSTPAEFQQTNIIPYLLPEGVGGFTEIFKNRVVLPFEGSYVDFHHVLQHELSHAFLFDRQNALGNKFSSAQQAIPLWFGEGLAEYSSLGWDLASEFFMMDAVQFGYVGNPAYDGLPGFLAYKGGQLFYHYLFQTFGPGMVRDWVGEVAKGKDLQRSFKDLTKVSLREVGEIWLREIRSIYWPELKERRYGKTIARQLTDHTQDMSGINMQPAISPDGKHVAFFSDRKPMVGIYVLDVEKEKVVRSLAYAGSERGHLSFYAFQSRMSWSPDGKYIVFVSKTGDRDVISIIQADGKGKAREIPMPGVQGILSPSFSPDGKSIVFSGMKDGFSDLFIWHLDRKVLRRLTHDIAADHNPVFAPSGAWIAFETDRPQGKMPQNPKDPFAEVYALSKYRDIYRIDTAGGTPALLLGGPYDEKTPAFGPTDSEIIFVSNRSGVNNLYLAGAPGADRTEPPPGWAAAGGAPDVEPLPASAGTWSALPISNLTSTAFTPSWSKAGDKLAFTVFEDRGWDVFLMRNPRAKTIREPLPKTRFIRQAEGDSTFFFSPLALENLTSYTPPLDPDSGTKVAAAGTGKGKDKSGGKATEAVPPAGGGKGPVGVGASGTAGAGTTGAGTAGAEPAGALGAGSDALKGPGVAAGTGVVPAAASGKGPGAVAGAEKSDGTRLGEAAGTDGTLLARQDGTGGSQGPAPAASAGSPADTLMAVLAPPQPPPPVPVDPDQVAGARVTEETDYLTRMGAFKLRPYKPVWGLEMAAADLGYNTFAQGVSGQTYITVSDLLGNHKISFSLSSGGSGLRSLNGVILYDLLKYRTDFSFTAFNFSNYVLQGPGLYYFDREWGGGISARYPLSIFTRFTFNLSGFSVTRNLYDAVYGVTVPDYIYPHERLNIVKPSLSWVNDNAEYGITGPVLGRRARLTASLVPALFDDSVAFWQLDGDFRKYWLMSKRYSFAFRVTAGFSQPLFDYANPQIYLGGGDDLIPFVARTNPENGPETLAEVAFSQLAVPMRGFRYYEFQGNRKFITNMEFRYPFIETLRLGWPLPLSINYLMGVLFVDYGGAWQNVPWQSELETAANTLGIGYGYGFRLNLGIFVLRYTQAYTVDDVGPGEGESRSYWSIGADF